MGLFDPIWMTRDYKKIGKAVQAVRGISDPEKLYEIAITAPRNEITTAAVDRIRDDALLYRIALSAKNEKARELAAERIGDQAILTKLAMEADDWTAEHAARKVRDPEQAMKLAMSGRKCARHGTYALLSDAAALKKIAFSAPTYDARVVAVSNLKDADTLLDILERDPEREIRKKAAIQLKLECREKAPLTEDQRKRVVQLLIREPDDPRYSDSVLSAFLLDDPDDLRRVYREAKRVDLRMEAFGILADHAEARALPALYQEANAVARSLPAENRRACRDAQERIRRRVLQRESGDPALLMCFIRDAEMGCNMASACLGALFDRKLDNAEGIGELRDNAVAAFLNNIPAYGKKDSSHDEKYCILHLGTALPEEVQGRYGFRVWRTEQRDEDQFGRYTYDATHVEWKGKAYS